MDVIPAEVRIPCGAAAFGRLRCMRAPEIAAGATHLPEEPATLEQVERLAGSGFARHLAAR